MSEGWLPPHQPNCLGCGDENPAGLGMRMRRDGDRVVGEVTLDSRHEGAPGYAHGGAVTTALDDAIGMLLFVLERPAVTARLEVDFRRPAFVDRRFEVDAWIDEIEGRKLHLRSALRDGGETVAEAKALFLEVDAEHFAAGARRSAAAERHNQLPW
jgi:acyl-CoA thioesterase FadM